MNRELKIASALTLSFITSVGAGGSNSISAPDFAFPKKVSEQSLTSLKKSVASHDSEGIVRSVLDFSLAQSAIGEDKMPNAFEVIDNTLCDINEPVTKSLLYVVKAEMLCEIYNDDKYNFNSRELPLSPLPKDYTEWSGKQFQFVISQLCDSAMLPVKELQSSRLDTYRNAIVHNENTPIYFPTLYDFVAYKTIAIRSELTDFGNMFALKYLSPAKAYIIEPHFVPVSTEATKILDTYAELLRFHSGSPAPYIYADLQRLDFVNNGLYNSIDRDESEKLLTGTLKSLYDDNASSELSGNILIDINDHVGDNMDLSTWLYNKAKHNISSFPAFGRIDCLKNIVKTLSAPSLNITHNNTIYPGQEFRVNIFNRNCQDYTVALYRLPSKFTSNGRYKGSLTGLKLIDKKTVTTPDPVPFSADQSATFTVHEPGYYIIVPKSTEIKNSNLNNNSYSIINCSRLAAGNIQHGNATIYVVDPMTGAPVSDASLMQYDRYNVPSKLGSTDANGFYSFSPPKYASIYPQKGNDIYAHSIYIGGNNRNTLGIGSAVSAFTELPLYHPGDTIKFAAIVYNYEGSSHKTVPDATVTATLFDANYQFVDNLTLTTDAFGRADGKFILPESGLTGRYNIAFSFGSEKLKNFWNKKAGAISFMVSDYKLPTFEIIADRTLNDTPHKGDVTLSGIVKTYSGMPLSNQDVTIRLSVAQNYWWRMSNDVTFYTDTVTTDSNGKWQIAIDKNVLDSSPAPDGFFNATVISTSPSGESQQTSLSFTRGDKYIIQASIPSDINVSSPVSLNIKVTDSSLKPVSIPVHYQLSLTDSVVQKGIIAPDMNWKQFSGNEYQLKLWLESDSTTNATYDIVLYTPEDNHSPMKQPLWMPVKNGAVTTDSINCKLLYGISYDNTYILLTVSTPEKILEQRWIKADRGMHYLDIDLPHNVDKAEICIQATKNMQTSQYNRSIVRKSTLKALNIKTESFRNKMIPGATETWTFRTTDINGKGEQSAMILNLYNSALNALQSPAWNLDPQTGYIRSLHLSTPSLQGTTFSRLQSNIKYLTCHDLSAPKFNLYSRSFVQSRYMLYESIMPTAKMTMRSAALKSTYDADEIVSVNEMKQEAEVEETAGMAYGVSIEHDSGAEPLRQTDAPEFAYRESNVVGGLWMPSLTTDADGSINVSFTVPNANTTWQLFATAFNKELTNSTLSALVVANKPVMVQPNLPRYLRTGDEATLKSLVMNNSDTVADILTTVEIFNPITNSIISTFEQTATVQPQQNTTVSVKVKAPVDDAMLGFRVKSVANGFADGEQSIIPILPASQPVVESTPFYIAPDSASLSIKLPKMPDNARVTLQYCDNPLWYVVTALPGLAEQEPKSAINAAYNIFSAAVAKGILKNNHSIAKALEYWTSTNGKDSTLVSMLEKNADLKTVLLNATPWLTDAKNDTERMTRLALLLDDRNINATINSGIKYLKKVQRNNGFAWMDQCDEPSLWATSEVLACLGRANQLGYMPDNSNLKALVNSALGYVQTQTEKMYAKYPESDYFSYVAMLDLWKEFKRSATSQRITTRTVQRIVKNWRTYSVGHKAEAVVMLLNHNYKTVAGTILASLREYSEYKPQYGMWWPSVGDTYGGSMAQLQVTADALEAFYAAEPVSKDIDHIRQWLILQKEAENWGSSAFTTDVISSILLTSKAWIQPANEVEIMLDGAPVTIPEADKYTGYFRTSLNHASNAMLTVNRSGSTPSFGAVFCQFTQDMADIKPQSCDAVSIEKHYYVYQGTEIIDPTTIKVGDKIQVALTIHVNRDMQYVAITDNRPACFEPVEQMPKPMYSDGICFYRENRDSATNLFVTNLPKGTYQLKYDMWVNNAGQFASGIATLQSQYAPQLTAHSAGNLITVNE